MLPRVAANSDYFFADIVSFTNMLGIEKEAARKRPPLGVKTKLMNKRKHKSQGTI